MHRIPLALALLLAGCAAAADDGSAPVGDDDDSAVAGDDEDDAGPEPAPLAALSDGACPELTGSSPVTSTFSSGGNERTVTVFLPSTPGDDLGALVAWHGLGDTPANFAAALQLQSFADTNNAVVAVPAVSDVTMGTWDFLSEGDVDLTLWDDLRTCLVDELGVEPRRFWTTGFSAGAIWSSFLVEYRGDQIAAAYIMSGGLPLSDYVTPAYALPALLTDGGATDTWNSISFAESTAEFATNLINDGHFVVRCSHEGGHQPPPGSNGIMNEWLPVHRYGAASPFEGQDPTELSDLCYLP